MMRQIVLDTETTGLSTKDGHRLIEIGCLEMIDRRITNNHFHCYMNPERIVEEGAIKVHGITNEFLKGKPRFADIAEKLFAYLNGAELIIHNAPFDLSFLDAEFSRINKTWAPLTKFCKVIDTLVMARHEHPGQKNSLDALCSRYSVNNTHRDLHGALLDAKLLANVYLLMTGGQSQLFSETAEKTELKNVDERIVSSMIHDLPVIYASATELNAHQDFMKKLLETHTSTAIAKSN